MRKDGDEAHQGQHAEVKEVRNDNTNEQNLDYHPAPEMSSWTAGSVWMVRQSWASSALSESLKRPVLLTRTLGFSRTYGGARCIALMLQAP
jgi:hypothetical protein